MNSLRERIVGSLLTLLPNRKFAATELLAADAGLVEHGKGAALARSNAVFVWSYYLRLLHLSSRRRKSRAYDRVVIHGEDNLRRAAAERKGILLLSVHLGDFDLAGGWLAARYGITPVVCTRPLRPRWRDALFSTVRRRLGIVLREANDTGIEMLETDLRRGCALLTMLDRRPIGIGSPSRLLGKPAVASPAISLLAARSGAPLVAAATWRGPGGVTMIWFGAPFTATDPGLAMAHISAAGDELGQLIRAYPEQWHVPANLREIAWTPRIEPNRTAARAVNEDLREQPEGEPLGGLT